MIHRSSLPLAILLLTTTCVEAPQTADDETGDEASGDGASSTDEPDDPVMAADPVVACLDDDPQEPNDSQLAATSVDDTQLFAASLCPGDEDWFTFTISNATYVGISAQYDGRQGDLDFDMRDGSGNLVRLAKGTAFDYHTSEGIHALVVPPGTYRVRVHLDSGDALAYQIRFNLLPHE